MDILDYKYVHAATIGSTGYFSCQPDIAANWPDCLALLAKRPKDQWLWEHALRQFSSLPDEARKHFLNFCKNGDNCSLANIPALGEGLRREFLERCADARAGLSHEKADSRKNSASERLCRAANASIHKHNLPEKHDFSSIQPPFEEIPDTAERLRAGRESGMRQWRNAEEKQALKDLAARALERLTEAGLLEGPEMRHEASLSPIALLRAWKLESSMLAGDAPWRLTGTATAYGRGFSLARARVSCLMEIVERASAHAAITKNGGFLRQPQLDCLQKRPVEDLACPDLPKVKMKGKYAAIHCVPGQDANGKACLVPAGDVFLFLNLPEARSACIKGSTGLASGSSRTGARLAALIEVMERHAHATMPHDPARCFTPASKDEILQALLDDYRARGIHLFFEDITCENGLPAYRCFVQARDGRIAQATGAGLNGREAALSALGETPWPYAYSQPAPFGEPSGRPQSPPPLRLLEFLPDYSSGNAEQDLKMLENSLGGFTPLYVDLSREDLGFPVVRCLVYGYETDCEFDADNPPGPNLLARLGRLRI